MTTTAIPCNQTLIIRGKLKEGFDPMQKIGQVKTGMFFNCPDGLGNMTHKVDGQRWEITLAGASEATLANIEDWVAHRHPKAKTQRVAA